MNLRAFFLDAIARTLRADPEELLLATFDDERRAITDNHTFREAYTFAFGVFRDFPGNPVRGDRDVWQRVLRMFDRVADYMRKDGSWDWHIPARKKTYTGNLCWALLPWLRLYEDFGENMDEQRRERTEGMLRRSLSVRMEAGRAFVKDPTKRMGSLNMMAHFMCQLWYGGGLFGEKEWRRTGAHAMRTIIGMQSEDGYWLDTRVPRGPVNAYSSVTLNPVAVYARLAGDADARAAIRRAAEFHLHCAYPDGTLVETFDERQRYHGPRVGPHLWNALAPFEEFRPYAAWLAERVLALRDAEEADVRSTPTADFCLMLDDVPDEETHPWRPGDFRRAFATIPAVSARRRPWYVCVSGATTDQPGQMYHHDLQNHIGVWHDAAGLAIGGGNSLLDPPFSTFRFGPAYLADQGQVLERDGAIVLKLSYGPIRATAAVVFEDDATLRIAAGTEGDLPPDSDFALHFPCRFGDALLASHGAFPLDDRGVFTAICGDLGDARVGPLTFSSATQWGVRWPELPVSIYDVPKRLPLEDAVLRVSARLDGKPVEIRVKVDNTQPDKEDA